MTHLSLEKHEVVRTMANGISDENNSTCHYVVTSWANKQMTRET